MIKQVTEETKTESTLNTWAISPKKKKNLDFYLFLKRDNLVKWGLQPNLALPWNSGFAVDASRQDAQIISLTPSCGPCHHFP